MNVIVECSCSGVKERSASAFNVLYPDAELPQQVVGKDNIREFYTGFPQDSNMYRHLDAIVKKNGRFSYYIEYDGELNITKMVDLLTGKDVY